MRDFLWRYFSMTGEIDVYLLYKEHEQFVSNQSQVATTDYPVDGAQDGGYQQGWRV